MATPPLPPDALKFCRQAADTFGRQADIDHLQDIWNLAWTQRDSSVASFKPSWQPLMRYVKQFHKERTHARSRSEEAQLAGHH